MKPGTQFLMRQFKISSEIYHDIKSYCKAQQISLTFFYESMLDWFLKKYGQTNIMFQASTKQDRLLSMWLKNCQMELVTKMARDAKVSDARVIYTALMLYVEELPEFAAKMNETAESIREACR